MSEMPNIKIQRPGLETSCQRIWLLPAADLERSKDLISQSAYLMDFVSMSSP